MTTTVKPRQPAALQPLIAALATHGWDLTVRHAHETDHMISVHAHRYAGGQAIRCVWRTFDRDRYSLALSARMPTEGALWERVLLRDVMAIVTDDRP